MILSDADIRRYIAEGKLVIEPLNNDTIRENGVDLRVGDEICELINNPAPLKAWEKHGPEDLKGTYYKCLKSDYYVIEPRKRYLLTTLEYIKVPPDIMAFVNQRSSIARLGLFVPPTIVDAGFEGELTIELVGGEFPVVLRRGLRFLHLVFAKLETPTTKPYRGKYTGQRGVRVPSLPL